MHSAVAAAATTAAVGATPRASRHAVSLRVSMLELMGGLEIDSSRRTGTWRPRCVHCCARARGRPSSLRLGPIMEGLRLHCRGRRARDAQIWHTAALLSTGTHIMEAAWSRPQRSCVTLTQHITQIRQVIVASHTCTGRDARHTRARTRWQVPHAADRRTAVNKIAVRLHAA